MKPKLPRGQCRAATTRSRSRDGGTRRLAQTFHCLSSVRDEHAMSHEINATYAKSIRRRALLTREGEIELAKRIESAAA
jgi:hypothetical protein